ncbi:MAG: diguanylate cyclase, partial [Firmicutes bacterium]|nr:diguanylate cyclase [Bacillota bacterium]
CRPAFPDTPEIIEKYETRIGVPFVIREKLGGIAYLGIKKTRDILKIRKIFEKNFDKVYQIGKEIAESIENINLYELSVIDELTKIYNKRYFSATLFNEVQKVREHGNPCSLILMDLDHFKNINDTYGHPQGDVVLKKVAACIKSCLRDGIDTMSRVGGEEFTVIMPSTSSEDAMKMAESIRAAVENYQLPPPLPTVTVSLGVATFPNHAPTAEELVDRADDALYESKNGGRNKATLSSGFRKPKEEAPYIGEIKKPDGEIPEFVKPWAVTKPEVEKPESQAFQPVKEEAVPVEEKGEEAEIVKEPVQRAPLELPLQSPIETVIESAGNAAPSVPWGAPRVHQPSAASVPVEAPPASQKTFAPSVPWGMPQTQQPTAPAPSSSPGLGAPAGILRPRGSGGRGLLRRTPPPPPTIETPAAEAVPLPPWAVPGEAVETQQPAASKAGAWAPGFPAEPTPSAESIGVVQEPAKIEEPAPVVSKPAEPPAPKVVEPTLDPVTGYFVKEYYDYRLVQELTAAFQNKKPCAVMFFSIDNVEKNKDKMTKEKLEDAIRSATEQVSLFLKEDTDIPAIYSDEEFAVILPRTNTQMAYNLSEQTRMMLGSMPFSDIGENIKLSFGVASYPEKASSPDELTNHAHEALNSARSAGGNKTIVYS